MAVTMRGAALRRMLELAAQAGWDMEDFRVAYDQEGYEQETESDDT